MPYMYFRISEGLSPEQKRKIADGTSDVINKHIGPPPWMAPEEQANMPKMTLEFHMVEIPADNLGKGGEPLKDGSFSAYVIINMNAMADRETKSAIIKEVTEAVAQQFGTSPESQDIIVEIVKTEEYNISHGGKLTYDSLPPGMTPPGK